MKPGNENILYHWQAREQKSCCNRSFERQFNVSFPLVRRLGLEKELEGHSGCVNCLQWSDDGRFLVSGSDDFKLIMWDMLTRKSVVTIPTGHQGNIFAVKFLPYSNNHTVASAAADSSIRICSTTTSECTHTMNCHIRRIKRLAVSNDSPHLLWSGSEDGTVRQYDMREHHSCTGGGSIPCKNVLINLTTHVGPASEVKCIQLHPLHSHYLAVGCSDPYVRLYDRRMLSITDSSSNLHIVDVPQGCVSYFAPGHISSEGNNHARLRRRRKKHYVSTYIGFSPDGQELIQNLGGDHIYIYNINKRHKPLKFSTDNHSHLTSACGSGKNNLHKNGYHSLKSTYEMRSATYNESTTTHTAVTTEKTEVSRELPQLAMELKLKGNDAFSQQNYFQAVVFYNKALKLSSDSSVLYANRAAALLKRAWDGDIYAALRDSYIAVALDPTHSKAFYRQARCLYELKWYQEAHDCLKKFKENFPQQAGGYSITKLENEILGNLKHNNNDEEMAADNSPLRANEEIPSRRPRIPQHASNDEEKCRRELSYDYEARLIGACNTTTDIKEANYFGSNGQYIIAGSDCGCMLLWDRETTNLLEAWQGDEAIVNCLQPHPTSCLIATSGIDPVIRLWSPRSIEDCLHDSRAKEVEVLVRKNQKRMATDPLEEMLRTMGYRGGFDANSDDSFDEGDDNDDDNPALQCRTN